MAGNKQELLEEILNDNERAVLNRIADDENAVEALRKVFLLEIYHNGTLSKHNTYNPAINFVQGIGLSTLRNEEKGEVISAICQGLQLLGNGFIGLQRFKTKEKVEKLEGTNPGV